MIIFNDVEKKVIQSCFILCSPTYIDLSVKYGHNWMTQNEQV